MTGELAGNDAKRFRTAPLSFPLHVVDEDGKALCGNLSGAQERFIRREGVDPLPTLDESRDDDPWLYFLTDLCANCRRSLVATTDHDAIQEAWQELQERGYTG